VGFFFSFAVGRLLAGEHAMSGPIIQETLNTPIFFTTIGTTHGTKDLKVPGEDFQDI
jgi:hypothetical protein